MIQVGSIVQWVSQANGVWREKQGTVVLVIPAGMTPTAMTVAPFANTHRNRLGGGTARKAESYMVSVPAPGKGKPSLFWPRTSKLIEVPEGG